MMKPKQAFILASLAFLLLPSLALAQVSFQQLFDPNFVPDKLIEDKVFSDTQTFGGPEGVQKFLDTRHSPLANTSPDFLAKLKEPNITTLKQGLDDPRPNLGRLRTAAELIWDAGQASGLNPQVIIVTLNKEQGLIDAHQDSNDPTLQKALDRAMGFDCPDSSGCGDLFPGFYYQLFGNFDSAGNRYLGAAKSLMKSFTTPGGRGPIIDGKAAQVGNVVTLDNTQGPPYNCPANQTITLANAATAALYRYTPHVCNGNYNFFKFFTLWFKYPNGTLLKLASDTGVYIIQNGVRLLVPAFVAQVRGLNLASTIIVSSNEIQNYPVDKPLGPADNTIVKVADTSRQFVFISNVKHPASDFVIKQRGLNPANFLTIPAVDAQIFDDGAVLTPSDGTIVRGQTEPAIYRVDNGTLKLFSAFTFKQYNAAKKVQLIPDAEIDTYPKQGFVAPLDNTLVKADKDTAVFLVQNGIKHPITADLFKNRGFRFGNVATLSADEVNGLATNNFVTPAEKTFFKVAQTGQVFEYKEGSKHPISAYVAKQRSIKADYSFDQAIVAQWTDGIAIPPRDGTLVKGDSSGTVYVVDKGQLRAVTANAFTRHHYSFKKVVSLPQAEVDAYAKGDDLVK